MLLEPRECHPTLIIFFMGRFYKNSHLAFLAKKMLPMAHSPPSVPGTLQSPTQPLISPEGLMGSWTLSRYLPQSILHSTRSTAVRALITCLSGSDIPRAGLILPSLLQADQQSPVSVSTKSQRTQVRLLSSPLDERDCTSPSDLGCGRNPSPPVDNFPQRDP